MNFTPADDGQSPKKLEVVIVGFGHAGKIHLKAYDKVRDRCRLMAIVEPNPDVTEADLLTFPELSIFRDLNAALDTLGSEVVVDFCVPAKINLSLVETALEHGVSRFLIEKPLGWDAVSTKSLVDKLQHCSVVYMDTYTASRGVQELLRAIEAQHSPPRQITVTFHKDRIPDSSISRGFVHDAVPNAWMIEGPHMLSICRRIAGRIERVVSTSTFDMDIGRGQVLAEHGGGHAVLEHENGAITQLDLNLCSERNERRIEVCLGNEARLVATLPASKSSEQHSTLEVISPGGQRKVLQFGDRPMEFCVQNAIRHLAGEAIPVGSLSDGLAVTKLVEKMTKKEQFWQNAPRQWKHFGPPLRPCPADIEVMETQLAQWVQDTGAGSCNVLLCGVTPEIVQMNWPAGTRLWAVEQSRAMIEEVWPARGSQTKLPVQANWTRLPFGPGSFDIVIGDGCFTSLEFPRVQQMFLESLHGVLRPNGLLIMRFFVQKDEPEPAAEVFRDLAAGTIGSFHAFKWRLAMAMQADSTEGVMVDTIWQAWNQANVTTDWPGTAVNTISTYRGSNHRLTFTKLPEIRELLAPLFEERVYSVPSYELGERCPIMVYSPC